MFDHRLQDRTGERFAVSTQDLAGTFVFSQLHGRILLLMPFNLETLILILFLYIYVCMWCNHRPTDDEDFFGEEI